MRNQQKLLRPADDNIVLWRAVPWTKCSQHHRPRLLLATQYLSNTFQSIAIDYGHALLCDLKGLRRSKIPVARTYSEVGTTRQVAEFVKAKVLLK